VADRPEVRSETDIRVAVVDVEVPRYVDVDADPEPIYWVDLRRRRSDDVRVALLDWIENRPGT
jgi:hypothetical protein